MPEHFNHILSSINNSELRIALEKIFQLLFKNASTINLQELNAAGQGGINSLQFNVNFTDGKAPGRLQWNVDDGTLEVGMPGGNVNLQIGQEHLVYVFNQTGSQIDNGKCVYIIDAGDKKPRIAMADADNTNVIPEAIVFGLTTEDIAHGSQGYVTTQGLVRDVNTQGITEGVPLWLSPTVPGGFQEARPNAPNVNVAIGYCIYAHVSQGIVLVEPTLIPRVVGLSDVDKTSTPSNGDTIRWNSTTERWEFGV
jgi:hypothetical protein